MQKIFQLFLIINRFETNFFQCQFEIKANKKYWRIPPSWNVLFHFIGIYKSQKKKCDNIVSTSSKLYLPTCNVLVVKAIGRENWAVVQAYPGQQVAHDIGTARILSNDVVYLIKYDQRTMAIWGTTGLQFNLLNLTKQKMVCCNFM